MYFINTPEYFIFRDIVGKSRYYVPLPVSVDQLLLLHFFLILARAIESKMITYW